MKLIFENESAPTTLENEKPKYVWGGRKLLKNPKVRELHHSGLIKSNDFLMYKFFCDIGLHISHFKINLC